ncbi:hypothetical protein F5Y13DRAFT_166130 [Hypoxylon sp. FL1857]|nr:hypothetical protein F5Y13DRAFT_166130 [Hypoxylon sp. FL1857]
MPCCSKGSGGSPKSECGVSNCKFPRDKSDCVPSKYCKKHTCEHFFSPSPGRSRCEKWKVALESVCPHHMICPISGCNQGRVQFRPSAEEPRFRREKYCYHHKCLVDGCGQLRSTLGQGPSGYQKYCNEHICRENGCNVRHMEGFYVCENHKCERHGCHAPRSSPRFCNTHNRCEWVESGGCIQLKEENYDFCSIHLQCETLGCRSQKARNSRHCTRHTCHERDCKVSSGNYDYCVEHRCGHEGCGEHRTRGATIYCARHSCHKGGCQLIKIARGQYCEAHICANSVCGNQRVLGELCELHFREQCVEEARASWDEDRQKLEDELDRNRTSMTNQDAEIRQRDQEICRLRHCLPN